MNSIWAPGPNWLLDEVSWPPLIYQFDNSPYNFDSLEPECKLFLALSTVTPCPFEIDALQYNSYLKLILVTAISINAAQQFAPACDILTFACHSHPMMCAELIWIRAEQEKYFADVLFALKNNGPHSLINSWGHILNHNSIICCTHRLQKAKFQILKNFRRFSRENHLLCRSSLHIFTC